MSIDKLKNLGLDKLIPTIYDFGGMTEQETWCKFAQKINIIIEHFNYLDKKFDNQKELIEQKLNYLLGEGLTLEVSNKILELINNGTLKSLINETLLKEINDNVNLFKEEIKSKLDDIVLFMPSPTTLKENTELLQGYLNKAKSGKYNVTINFQKGTYDLNTCIIYSNTTLNLHKETILNHYSNTFYNPETKTNRTVPILFMNAKPYDEEDSKIIGYNGYSNIKINGGVIDCYSALLFCHGKNISVENVYFKNAKTDHYIQIGACKNVTIKNCVFEGMLNSASNRQYVEMIQIDWMTSTGQPYWVTTSNLFDSTINDGIIIDNCEFKRGNGDYNYLKTCIGSHSSDGENKNKNITIKNCKFDNFEYRGLTIYNMENVILENNNFNTTVSTGLLNVVNSNNVIIKNENKFSGGSRGLYISNSNNIDVNGCTFSNIIADSDLLLIGESENINVRNVVFKDCSSVGYNVLVRSCTNVIIDSCKDINCNANLGYFTHVYTKNGIDNNNIVVRNTITNLQEIRLTSANSIICNQYETLFNGSVSSGDIVLSDDIAKFKDLKITYVWYGTYTKDLTFNSNIFIHKEFNIRDNVEESLRINFMESRIDLVNSKLLRIIYSNQLDLFNNEVSNIDSVNYSIKKIEGIRVRF